MHCNLFLRHETCLFPVTTPHSAVSIHRQMFVDQQQILKSGGLSSLGANKLGISGLDFPPIILQNCLREYLLGCICVDSQTRRKSIISYFPPGLLLLSSPSVRCSQSLITLAWIFFLQLANSFTKPGEYEFCLTYLHIGQVPCS